MANGDPTTEAGHDNSREGKEVLPEKNDIGYKLKAGAFLGFAGSIGLLGGFGAALASAKKQDPRHFDAGMVGIDPAASGSQKHIHTARHLHESGAALATRALGYGTLYAVLGCGALFFSIWKLMGVKDLTEFREKVGTVLPTIPRNSPPQGRTEFSGLNDLLQYIIDKDKEEKMAKLAAAGPQEPQSPAPKPSSQ